MTPAAGANGTVRPQLFWGDASKVQALNKVKLGFETATLLRIRPSRPVFEKKMDCGSLVCWSSVGANVRVELLAGKMFDITGSRFTLRMRLLPESAIKRS